MAKYRKKPVLIEAVQWLGQRSLGHIHEFVQDCDREVLIDNDQLIIPTLEGDHKANLGDWIIKGVQGELYPCKPDIFEATYEPAD